MGNLFKLAIIVVPLGMAIACFLSSLKAEKLTHNTVLAFTGGLGSGKTYMAVRSALKFYSRQSLKYKLGKVLPIKSWKDAPHLYSNIPIRIKGTLYAEKLTKAHLLLCDRLPEKSIVVIDEVGQVASQYDYDNPYVMCEVQELIRFYRHYTDGKIIVTDQSSSNIVVPIRRRINLIYCLNDFRRYLKITPFFKVEVSVLEVTEETMTNVNTLQSTEKHLFTSTKLRKPYFWGYLPYKWQSTTHYDTRCYSERYADVGANKRVKRWDRLKTKELINIEAGLDERKYYAKYLKHKPREGGAGESLSPPADPSREEKSGKAEVSGNAEPVPILPGSAPRDEAAQTESEKLPTASTCAGAAVKGAEYSATVGKTPATSECVENVKAEEGTDAPYITRI